MQTDHPTNHKTSDIIDKLLKIRRRLARLENMMLSSSEELATRKIDGRHGQEYALSALYHLQEQEGLLIGLLSFADPASEADATAMQAIAEDEREKVESLSGEEPAEALAKFEAERYARRLEGTLKAWKAGTLFSATRPWTDTAVPKIQATMKIHGDEFSLLRGEEAVH